MLLLNIIAIFLVLTYVVKRINYEIQSVEK